MLGGEPREGLRGDQPVTELFYLNVPAHVCSNRISEQGRRIAQYRGDEYAIIGFFFARNHSDHSRRTLFYILRPFAGDGNVGLHLTE